MSPRNRALLRWAFIIIFLILAPVIILSTAGYRFNFGKERLEKTGVIIVDTVPSGASVSLNDRPANASTPARLTRVSPGTYRVRVEKPGFHSWERDVTVDESQSLFLNDIVLLRDELPTFERDQAQTIASAFSPDGRYAGVASEERGVTELHVYDFKTGNDRLPYRAPFGKSVTYALAWSADSQRLLITRKSTYPTTYYLWNASEPLSTSEINPAQAAMVAETTPDAVSALSKLPSSTQTLGASWSTDGKRVLYWNELELHVFDVAENTDELVTRVSSTIKKATWYADDRLILYATDDGLSSVESAHEGARVTTQLAAMQNVADFALSKSGDTVWLVGTIGHQQGVFSLPLK